VAKYYAQFEKLSHGILLYNPSYDDVYFVTRFLAGLKEEIRAAITLHRPRDIATASTLALLQEEELHAAKQKSFGQGFTKVTSQLGLDKNGVASGDKASLKRDKFDTDDKWATLKQYHRRNGLCYKCGGKWSTNHSCLEQIPICIGRIVGSIGA
jgi:hypothetical protein